MNAKKKKKRSLFRERAEPRSIRSPAPAPWCAEAFPSQNHPPTQPASLPVPRRPAHPISPPGRRRVSSSALALQTAQKHLVRVEGTRARQDRMWKEAGASGETRGSASRNTTCTRRRRREEKEKLQSVSCLPCTGVEGLGPRG